MQIAGILERLGVKEYSNVFVENIINLAAFKLLTRSDLEEPNIPTGLLDEYFGNISTGPIVILIDEIQGIQIQASEGQSHN